MWFLLSAIQLVAGSGEVPCLPPEPASVTLTGVLARETFPGPPNFDSIADGDAAETYFMLRLDQPICLSEIPDTSVPMIQLVFLGNATSSYEDLQASIGQHLNCRGTLFAWQTGHHHTPILLTVSSCATASNQSLHRSPGASVTRLARATRAPAAGAGELRR